MDTEAKPQLKNVHLNHVSSNKEFGAALFLGPGRELLNLRIFHVIHGGPYTTPEFMLTRRLRT